MMSIKELERAFKATDLRRITVWKKQATIEKYGQRAKNGVIEITIPPKRNETPRSGEKRKAEGKVIYEKVRTLPFAPSADGSESGGNAQPNLKDPVDIAARLQDISDIKSIARKEGKPAYLFKGRTYIFAKEKDPDPLVATFTEQDGMEHHFLLDGVLVNSIDAVNKYERYEVQDLGIIFADEAQHRFNLNEAVVTIQTTRAGLTAKK